MDTGSADDFLRRFRETGDPGALGALFDATAPALFRIALRLAPDPASAEDALQETFLDLFEVAREWDPARPALPWLAGVLRHRVERVRRTASRRPDARRLPPPAPPIDPPAAAAAAEERDRARRAMLDLEEPYRSVALLRWQYGLEPAEIAEVRGDPPGTVWSLLSRAKEKLEKTLAGTNALAVAFLPGAGLDSVRAAVVRHAAAKAASLTATATTVGGGLLVSKKVFVVVAILCIALGTTLTILIPRGGFRGRVVDAATGKPLAGARVVLPGTTPEETVTDADGRFVLDGEGRETAHVTAEAEGLVVGSLQLTAGAPADIPLEQGDTVTGRILSEGGAAVAGARISIFHRTIYWEARNHSAVTDADGRFRCEAVDRSNYHNCIVRAEGYGKLVKDFNPAREGPGLVDLGDLVLPPTRTVEGVLLSGRGTPIGGIRLVLRGPLDMERACRAPGTAEIAATDVTGVFRFEGVAAGRYSLGVDGGGMGVPAVAKEVLVAERDLLGVELRIEDTGWLRVKVVDESGTPQPGVTVHEEEGALFALSGEDGVAVLENLPPKKRVFLTVQGGTAWQAWKYVNLRVPEPTIPDGCEVTLVVALADSIRGVVLDEDGRPMQGAIVSTPAGHYAFTTKDDGVFRLSVPRGTTVDLLARTNPDDPVRRAGLKGVKAPAEGVVLRMKRFPRTGTLTFRLLDASGLPVPRFDLKVYAGEERTVRTDGEGRVTLEGLLADETQFFARIPPQGPDDPWPLPGGAVVPPAAWIVPDGREVDFRLLPGEEIRGTVVDPAGTPAKGARVFAFRAGKWMSTEGLTDDGGRYRIMVPAGEILPSIRAVLRKDSDTVLHAYATDVRPGTKDLLLRLEED